MNGFIGNFVGFDGRLNRQGWWLSAIALAVVSLILNWILGLFIQSGPMTLEQMMSPEALRAVSIKGLITGIILAYPYATISVKRRHDRGNSGMDAYVFTGLLIVYNLIGVLGLTSVAIIGPIIGLVFAVFGIYMLVQLGFLKGTAGPNAYGPDPLGG